MALSTTITYNNSANFTFDPTLVNVTSLADLQLITSSLSFTEDFADDTGFTSSLDLVEFTGGVLQQKDTRISNAVAAATYTTSTDLSWATFATLTGSLHGTPIISGATLVCSGTEGVSYAESGIANSGAGSVKFKYTPNYTGNPPANVNVITISKAGGGNNDKLGISHSPSGDTMRMWLSNSGGSAIYTATTIGASPSLVAGTKYEFELGWDPTGGTVRLFIDGTLHGTLTPGAWDRGLNADELSVGATTGISYNRSEASYEDVVLFSTEQHSATYTAGYTVGEAVNLESQTKLPQFDYSGSGNIVSVDSISIVSSNTPKYSMAFDTGSYFYWSGSWSVSDGTYSQATDLATFNTNIGTLPSSGSSLINMRVHYTDNNSEHASVDSLELHYSGPTYSVANPTVLVKSTFRSDALCSFVDSINPTSGSGVNYTINLSGTDKYWTGSLWANATSGFLHSNSAGEINTNVASLTLAAGGDDVKIKAFMHSPTGGEQIELHSVSLCYDFAGPLPIEADECNLYGYIRDLLGEVNFTNAQFQVTNEEFFFNGDVGVAPITRAADITSEGTFDISVVETASVSRSYNFRVLYTDAISGTTQTVDIGNATVPNTGSLNISELTFS